MLNTCITARDRAKPIEWRERLIERATPRETHERRAPHVGLALELSGSAGVHANRQRLQLSITGMVGLGDGYGVLALQPLRTRDCTGRQPLSFDRPSPNAASYAGTIATGNWPRPQRRQPTIWNIYRQGGASTTVDVDSLP